MFTRIVEVTTKPENAKELSNTINDKVLPVLKKQDGFVDETVLVSDEEQSCPGDSASGIPKKMLSSTIGRNTLPFRK